MIALISPISAVIILCCTVLILVFNVLNYLSTRKLVRMLEEQRKATSIVNRFEFGPGALGFSPSPPPPPPPRPPPQANVNPPPTYARPPIPKGPPQRQQPNHGPGRKS